MLIPSGEEHIKNLDKSLRMVFAAPIFIISAPRSGSTLLFNLLRRSPEFLSVGGESHHVYAQFPHLRAENASFDSGSLTENHADAVTALEFRSSMASLLVDRYNDKVDLLKIRRQQHFLEKTPRNALNIPFIKKVFPNARFIMLHRNPKENISSIIEAWNVGQKTGRFVTFSDLPGWDRKKWCLLLPLGWRKYNNSTIAEIAAFQWSECNRVMLEQLEQLGKQCWISLSYEKLLTNPQKEVARLCKFSGVKVDKQMLDYYRVKLPLSETVVTKPNPQKWRKNESEIEKIMDIVFPVWDQLKRLSR